MFIQIFRYLGYNTINLRFLIYVHIRVIDYLPVPPTPINNAFPFYKDNILVIFNIYKIASSKNTKFIYLV